MKITDLIANPGRPVAYYPGLRVIAGSVNAAILLCQLIYWRGKQADAQGWIAKRVRLVADDPDGFSDPRNQSLERETGLSYKELRVARRQLRERGLVREQSRRLIHTLLFQVDLDAVCAAWDAVTSGHVFKAHFGSAQRSLGESPKGTSLDGTYIDYTESTTEAPAAALSFAENATSPEDPNLPHPTTPVEALRHPDIQLFQEVCGRVPGVRDYSLVIQSMRYFRALHGERTVAHLRSFWLAWSSRRRRLDGKPYDPGSLTWLTEWAINGRIPADIGGNYGIGRRAAEVLSRERQDLTAADACAAELINQRRHQTTVPEV